MPNPAAGETLADGEHAGRVLATYGTFPLAIFLMWVFETQSNDGTVAGFFFDSGTFVVSAILIWSIVVPKRAERDAEPTSD